MAYELLGRCAHPDLPASPVRLFGLAALLNSRWLDAVGERYGSHLVDVLKTAVEPLAPINSELRVKEGDWTTQYDKIVAGGEVTVEGNTVTLPVARSLMKSASPETRQAAFLAHRSWFLQHRDQIAPIFDQLVQIRHQMGTNLGHQNFSFRLDTWGWGAPITGQPKPHHSARTSANLWFRSRKKSTTAKPPSLGRQP